MKTLQAAVVGVGNMGQHHARVYSELPNVHLVAVCDLDEKAGKEIAQRTKTLYFRNYQEIISAFPDLAVVSVAVPTKSHRAVASYFLKQKINVLLEKPIAPSIQAGQSIIRTAKLYGAKLTVGHVERFNPAVLKLKEIIKNGKLGEVISLVARRVGGFPPQIKDSNVVIDLAVHDVDIINYLLEEEPCRVIKHKAKFHARRQEDCGEIFLLYQKAAGFVQINWVTPIKIRSLAVTGTKAYAELNYITQELCIYKARLNKKVESFSEFLKFGHPSIEEIKIQKAEPLKLEIVNFLEAIRRDRHPLVSPQEALRSLTFCL